MAEESLKDWYRRVRRVEATNLIELREAFPSADPVGKCTVFNVGGNKYRIIAGVSYRRQKVYIRFVLSHAEYDKGNWKTDC